jgi:hypothetical protein
VIVEDAEDTGTLHPYTLRTNYDDGVTDKIAAAAIAMLES